jgi:ring-1,2-phenylacetyl-CoA epoxidase subunit PaaE
MTVIDAPRRRHHAVFHKLRVGAVETLTDDSVVITFDVPEILRDDYAFLPGQHLTVRMPGEAGDVRRNYSICSSATSGELRIAVKRLEGGAFSAWATSTLQPGDELEVMTPTGRFTVALDPAHRKRYAAIAAGSGITPVMSLVTTILEVEPQSSVTLVYGNRTTSSIMFLEELLDVKNRYPERFEIINVLSRETQDVELLSGRLDRARLSALLDALIDVASVDEWFLCGPFDLVQDARAMLLDAGVDRRHVHLELFHVEGTAPRQVSTTATETAGDGSEVTIMLDGRSTTFSLPFDAESVLDATLKQRPDAPFACKGGVCGTCRAKLVEGHVDMDRNFALEQDEIDNGFVLACQSHPSSPRVVLDFDQ